MADNSLLPISGGTETFANDDIGSVKYPRVKATWGPDGTANDTDVATGKPMPMQVRSATGLIPIGEPTDAKSTATDTTSVTGISIWKQISASAQAIASSVAGTLTVASHAVTNAGTFAVQAAITAASGAIGSGAVASGAVASGAYASGSISDGAQVTLGAKADAKSSATDTTAITLMSVMKQVSAELQLLRTALGSTALDLGISTGGSRSLRVAIDSAQVQSTVAHDAVDSGDPLKVGGYAKAAAPTDVSADADRVNAWFLRNGAQAINITAAGALIPGDATTGLAVGGAVAHDGVDSGKPLKTGGRARSSEIAAVASDDRTDFISDLVGKQIVLPYANPENFVSGVISSAMTGTTSTSLLAAPASGLRNYITQITVSNSHATVGTDIIIQDGSGGTTLYVIPAAAVYGGAVITFPTPLRQPTTATAIFCANVTTGSNTKVSASGYKGV